MENNITYYVSVMFADGSTHQKIDCPSYNKAKKTFKSIIYGSNPKWDSVMEASLVQKSGDQIEDALMKSKKKKYSYSPSPEVVDCNCDEEDFDEKYKDKYLVCKTDGNSWETQIFDSLQDAVQYFNSLTFNNHPGVTPRAWEAMVYFNDETIDHKEFDNSETNEFVENIYYDITDFKYYSWRCRPLRDGYYEIAPKNRHKAIVVRIKNHTSNVSNFYRHNDFDLALDFVVTNIDATDRKFDKERRMFWDFNDSDIVPYYLDDKDLPNAVEFIFGEIKKAIKFLNKNKR